jgi:hypothetical protein
MRWPSWLLRHVGYASLVPVLQTCPGLLNHELFVGSSADDCEAFLVGRLAEYRMGRQQFVSVSDWTNLLAHGTEDDLRTEIAHPIGRRPRTVKAGGNVEWREARQYLVTTLLHRVGDEEDLKSLQRLVLVPLELELAAGAMDWSPRTWVIEVNAAVERHERRHVQTEDHKPHTPT